jgi:predicted Zn-dependent protease with MMP-like domain/Flp pilus assembly protein TadD
MKRPSKKLKQQLDDLLDQAEAALQDSDIEAAVAACRQALALSPKDADALYLLGEALRYQGDLEQAIELWRQCVLVAPDYSQAWSGLGLTYLSLLQWEEARRALNRAIREDPSNPEAWYGRAILRERREDFDGADRDLARAARLDPDSYPYPLPLDDDAVDQIVEKALKSLHPTLRDYLSNVAILLDEVPAEDVLRQYDPPADPGEILGYFSGYSLMDRTTANPWSHLPSAIVLFRRNLQRYARDADTLVEELRITFYHEVGHFLGLDEEDLKERGLE